MSKKEKIDKSLYTRLKEEKYPSEKMSKKDKIDRSLYTRLKEEKDQRDNHTSFSNQMYSKTMTNNNKKC